MTASIATLLVIPIDVPSTSQAFIQITVATPQNKGIHSDCSSVSRVVGNININQGVICLRA